MNDMDKAVLTDILQKTIYYNRKPTNGGISVFDKCIKSNLDDDVRRILNLDTNRNERNW